MNTMAPIRPAEPCACRVRLTAGPAGAAGSAVPTSPVGSLSVSLVIPAKNESANLPGVLAQVPQLEQQAVVSGGMLPKLNACKEALTHGVKRVRILPASSAALLPDLLSSRVDEGTEVMVA